MVSTFFAAADDDAAAAELAAAELAAAELAAEAEADAAAELPDAEADEVLAGCEAHPMIASENSSAMARDAMAMTLFFITIPLRMLPNTFSYHSIEISAAVNPAMRFSHPEKARTAKRAKKHRLRVANAASDCRTPP